VARFIFKYFVVRLYQVYFILKKWLSSIFAPAKNKMFYPLLSKSTIHVVIIFVALAVVFNSFFTQETRAEEFGQNTILASIITDVQDVEIVETAIKGKATTNNYSDSMGVLTIYDVAATESLALDTEEGDVMTSEGSAALVKPGLAQTTLGDRPRDDVIYYTVEGGDTVSTIAEKFSISTNTILWENKLGPRDYIKPGNQLTILPYSGVSHQVKSGDTLDKIAKKYSVDSETIIEYNQLADASAIETNQVLLILGGSMPEEPKPTIQPNSSSSWGLFNIPPPASATSGTKLQWPTTSRKISQYYKWRHYAIDIAGDYTSPTYAADSGRVEAVGWGSGYGNRIIIDHGNGIKTLYAHHSKMFVKTGDYVSRGQTIGMIGCTGWCTGSHVHFEVIVNGQKVNPLNYL